MPRGIAAACAVLLAGCASHPGSHPAPALDFPASWAGEWSGELRIWDGPGEPVLSTGMALAVSPPEEPGGPWGWTLQYEGQPPREYHLVEEDAARGLWRIDERNSIVLPAKFSGGVLASRFQVMGSDLAVLYRMRDDGRLAFELLSTDSEGVGTGGADGAPPVLAHPVRGWQQAVLGRSER